MSLFDQSPYPKTPAKIKFGTPCKRCPHTHVDHSIYQPQLCLIEHCDCQGLKLDLKPIS